MGKNVTKILEESDVLKYFNIKSQFDLLRAVVIDESGSSLLDSATAAADAATDALAGDASPSNGIISAAANTSLADALLNVTEGAWTTATLITSGEELEIDVPDLEKLFRIYFEHDSFTASSPAYFASTRDGDPVSIKQMIMIGDQSSDPSGINSNPSAPSKSSSPNLSLIMLQSPKLSPAARDAGAVEFFMNTIPPLEFSRCVPYIDLQLRIKRPVMAEGKIRNISMMRFLGAFDAVDDGLAGEIVQARPVWGQDNVAGASELTSEAEAAYDTSTGTWDAYLASTESEIATKAQSYTGMEIFTSPQTLVNYDRDLDYSQLHAPSSTGILDVTRPFMTLRGISVTHVPMRQGAINVIRAKVDITLHDRSRLGEVASFIAPGVFKDTEAQLEFGWAHPDGGPDSDNVFGMFLNAMRNKQKYFLVKSDYQFTPDGQVTISLDLANCTSTMLKGYNASSGYLVNVDTVINTYQQAIDAVRQQAKSDNVAASVLPKTVFASQDVTDASMMLPAELYKEIKEVIDLAVNDDQEMSFTDAISKLDEILEGDSSKYETGKPYSVFTILNEKIGTFRRDEDIENMALDPFLRVPTTSSAAYSALAANFIDRKRYVSFGRLVLAFIGQPIAAAGDYDEVQIYFHSFNESAGAMHGMNIASFPVNLDRLHKLLKKSTEKSRDINVFTLFGLCTRIVQDIRSFAYGISRDMSYEYGIEAENSEGMAVAEASVNVGDNEVTEDDSQDSTEKVETFLFERLNELGCPKQEFKPPIVSYMIESLPSLQLSDDGSAIEDGTKTIMRIHIVDEKASPYTGESFVLQSLAEGEQAIMNSGNQSGSDSAQSDSGDEEKILERAERESESEALDRVNAEAGSTASTSLDDVVDSVVASVTGDSSVEIKQASMEGISTDLAHTIISNNIPTIMYGIAHSAISTIDIRGTTTGGVADSLIVAAYQKEREGQVESGQGAAGDVASMTLIPALLTINSLGCPLLAYAQQFFVRLGTGTTLEQVYGITKLSHTIRAGEYKSTAGLHPMNSGKIFSKRALLTGIKQVMETEDSGGTNVSL